MNIGAFDLATFLCGWAAGDGSRLPEVGHFSYQQVGDDLGQLAALFERDLNNLHARIPLGAVIYESPLLLPSDRLLPLRKIYGMGMQLEHWARKRGIPCAEQTAKMIKKRITGSSTASKDEMVDMVVRRLGVTLPKGPERRDMADAVGAFVVGVDTFAKQHQPRWDAALFGARGTLL